VSTQPAGRRAGWGWLERISQAFVAEPEDLDQLVEMLRRAQARGLLGADELEMIEGVLQVSELRVRDVMIPRAQMVVVPVDAELKEMLPIIVESAHSRFPVVGESRDEVEGILLAKDLLRYFADGSEAEFDIDDVLRPATLIPESKRLNVLLREFRKSRNHMAIVVDEYGGVAGLVTIEDVLEQIVGEITDEHDIEEGSYVVERGPGHYTVKALTPIEDFNEALGTDLSDEEFDTIGGLVVHRFGHLPKRGETVEFGGLRFTVLRADNRRVHLLEVERVAGSDGS
jgi:magnesium and cobalt transporter